MRCKKNLHYELIKRYYWYNFKVFIIKKKLIVYIIIYNSMIIEKYFIYTVGAKSIFP